MNTVQSVLTNALLGLLFGIGLVISGMSNPSKVLNFLDVLAISSGSWDPSLAFVMAGAVLVTAVGYRFVLGLSQPLFSKNFYLPASTDWDVQLITGSALFGLGWGLTGFCPGPAFTALGNPGGKGVLFVIAMFIGMACANSIKNR